MAKKAVTTRFGSLLRSARRNLGITLVEAAAKLGVSKASLGGWENEKPLPGLITVRKRASKVSRVLKVTTDELEQAWRVSYEARPEVKSRRPRVDTIPTTFGVQLVTKLAGAEISAGVLKAIAEEAASYARPLTVIDLLRQVQLHLPKE